MMVTAAPSGSRRWFYKALDYLIQGIEMMLCRQSLMADKMRKFKVETEVIQDGA
jgi:hypothetical protein